MQESSQPLQFRPFQPSDAPRLGEWLEASGLRIPPGAGAHAWAVRLLGDPHIVCSAAIQNGQCVGFLRLDVGPDRCAEVTLLVDPRHQGVGLGGALLREALRWARQHGLRQLLAVVSDQNERALAFFAKHGFDYKASVANGFQRLERFIHRAGEQPPLEIQG